MGEWRCLGAGIGCGGRDDPGSCDDARLQAVVSATKWSETINPVGGATRDYYSQDKSSHYNEPTALFNCQSCKFLVRQLISHVTTDY